MFSRLLEHNSPKILIGVGVVMALITGFAMPVTGVLLSELLTFMTSPWEYLAYQAKENNFEFSLDSDLDLGRQYLESNMKLFSTLVALVALICGLSSFFQKVAFGYLGENTTFKIRKLLYHNILRKNIGWFDDKDNGTSVLTSAMA